MSEQKHTGGIKVSTAKGNNKKQGQVYQNFFGFKHPSKQSTKCKKIIATPLDRLCQRCYEMIQWKIDYRKYKPLTAMHRCNKCQQKCITKAYRTVCDGCAAKDKNDGCKICTKCAMAVTGSYASQRTMSKADQAQADDRRAELEDALEGLKLKSRRLVERKMKGEEIKYSYKKKTFVYCDDEEKEFEVKNRDDDQYGDEDDIASDDDEETKGEITKLENVDEALDAIDNEKIESKIAEVAIAKLNPVDAQEESKQDKSIAMCKRQHPMKHKMTLPDCYVGKGFNIDENFLYCDGCSGPIDFANVWFHHCKKCEADFCQKCKGTIFGKTDEDARHQWESDNDESDEEEQIEEQKN